MNCNKNPARRCVRIENNTAIIKDIYEMVLEYPSDFSLPQAGQFVNLYCNLQGRLLPRPISVCEISRENPRHLHLVYAVVGKGTAEFAALESGTTIDLMGPLGKGFTIPASPGKTLLVGGGVGTPPMVELAKTLSSRGWTVEIVVGFRDEPYLIERLEKFGKVFIATDSGRTGFHGNVVQLIDKEKMTPEVIFACGPRPMLQGVQNYAFDHGIPAQLSLEERMGCGFGGCVGCVTKITADNELGFQYKKVCKDGPVFSAEEVIFS